MTPEPTDVKPMLREMRTLCTKTRKYEPAITRIELMEIDDVIARLEWLEERAKELQDIYDFQEGGGRLTPPPCESETVEVTFTEGGYRKPHIMEDEDDE